MKSVDELIKIKFNLECIGVMGNTLYRTNGITCDDIEQCCVMYTLEGYRYYHAENVHLRIVDYERAYLDEDYLKNIGLVWDETRKESWYFIPQILDMDTSDAFYVGDINTFDTFVVVDHTTMKTASSAWSVRKNEISAEVAVDTYEGYRNKGYAKQVVAAWAEYQLDQNKMPIYAHRAGNDASAALARSVGAVWFADVISYQ